MLEQKLDRLVDAFESHGVRVRSNLRPGASEAQLDSLSRELGVMLPDQFRALYTWRNGHVDQTSDNLLAFRDNIFIGLEAIGEVHETVVSTYSRRPGDDETASFGVDPEQCVPFAEFMGAAYLVACGPQSLTKRDPHPVLSAYHGVDLFYYSIESMVDTCIDWVEQPDYMPEFREAPDELTIWQRHNPGIFSNP